MGWDEFTSRGVTYRVVSQTDFFDLLGSCWLARLVGLKMWKELLEKEGLRDAATKEFGAAEENSFEGAGRFDKDDDGWIRLCRGLAAQRRIVGERSILRNSIKFHAACLGSY